jgi:LmbE family N-acetylglucosaminyl deacetylase
MERLAPLVGRTLVIVAHPDDEIVGCGSLLQRVREPLVLFATDGAPRDRFFWEKYGSREAYAARRRQEARAALAELGVAQFEFLPPANNSGQLFVDQDLFLNIPRALEAISDIVTHMQPEALLTLAYEGGHPDHDTCAFLAWWIAREHVLPAWEMPLYHRSTDGMMVRQEFIVPEGDEVLFDATLAEVERKRRALRAYTSQHDVITEFNPAVERFRPQASYNFRRPPHPGILNYEAWQWPVTGSQLVQAFGCCIDCHLHPFEVTHPGSAIRGLA